jgi:hypothetical protein
MPFESEIKPTIKHKKGGFLEWNGDGSTLG